MVLVDVGHSLRDLGARDSPAKEVDLLSDLVDVVLGVLLSHELVVQVVSASEDLDVSHVVAVDGGSVDSAVVHLSNKDLVSEEVVSEDSRVGVGEEMAVLHGHVGKVSEEGVHGVVLLEHVVQVTGVGLNSVVSEHVLEEEETVVVGVLDRWSIVEHSSVGVDHLIVSDHEKTGVEHGLFSSSLDSC